MEVGSWRSVPVDGLERFWAKQNSPSLRLLWGSHSWWRCENWRIPHCFKSLCSDAELVVTVAGQVRTSICRLRDLGVGSYYHTLVKKETVRKLNACCIELAIALYELIFTICKCSINPITNPNPDQSHTLSRGTIILHILSIFSNPAFKIFLSVSGVTK
jgi:hypothetical protein